MKSILHPLLLSSAIGLGLALPLAAQEIGRVALSVSDVRGTPPGGAPRPLAIGTGVMADESVEPAAAARADLLFRDETSLSLGPSTRITLDRFVYDPAAGSGEMAVSLTRGALRFVGGALSEGRPAVVTFDPEARELRRSGSQTVAFPDGVEASLVSSASAGPSAIVFFPDGSSSGGALALDGAGRRERVAVDWLTSRIERQGA